MVVKAMVEGNVYSLGGLPPSINTDTKKRNKQHFLIVHVLHSRHFDLPKWETHRCY